MRILWCADTVHLPTGYAQVTRNLLTRFQKAGIDAHQLSWMFQGMDEAVPYPLHYPMNHDETYGNKGSVPYWTNTIKPDIVAFLADSFMIKWLGDEKIVTKDDKKMIIKNRQEINAKTLFYFPFDSADAYTGVKEVMEQIDIKVAMSQFGQKILKKELDMDSFYIPHGVDTTIYRPIPREIVQKERENFKLNDKFIIGCIARNQSRKMYPALFQAFVRFHKKHPKSALVCHCDPVDPQGWNLLDLSNRLNLKLNEDVFFSMKRFCHGEGEATVNLIYNLMDIHTIPTTGEGFGLPIIESMAAGIPNILTDCTTSRELIGKNGLLVRRVGEIDEEGYIIGQLNTKRAIPSIKDMVDKFEYLYDNEAERKRMGEMGRREVLKTYNWERVTRAWLELFEHGKVTEYSQEVK